MTQFTAAKVARDLRAHGIVVVKFSEGDDVEDGAVVLSDRLHVQVCALSCSRLNLVLETERGTFKFFPDRRSFAGLLADLQKLAREQPAVLAVGETGMTDCRCPACNQPVVGTEDVVDGSKPTIITACQHCNTSVRVVDSPAGELSKWYFEAGILAS